MLGTLKSAAESVSDALQGMASAGLDKLKLSVDAFVAASPELEEIGYRVNAIELCCALSPCITVFLDRQKAPHDEAFEGLLARHTDNVTLRTVVSLLRQTEKIIAKFDLQKQRCTSLALELGVPPRMRLLYTEKVKTTPLLEPPPLEPPPPILDA